MEGIKKAAYRRYICDWMSKHRIGLDAVNAAAEDWLNANAGEKEPVTSFSDWVFDQGFGGSLWACFDEFLGAEYLDAGYMRSILAPDEFREYCKERKLDCTPVTVVPTPAGNVIAKRSPFEYDGVYVFVDVHGEPGVVVEYDPGKGYLQARVYGAADPDGDPEQVCRLS